MRFLRSMFARARAWYMRVTGRVELDLELDAWTFASTGPLLYRDVTQQGVRVYSLCGSCGARMECSATLCEECAQGPHTSAF